MNAYISALLAAHSAIAHGFFGRRGGVSDGIFASLNCGYGSGDEIANVAENRRRVTETLGTAQGEVSTAFQVHGDVVAYLEKPWQYKDAVEADALVTTERGVPIGILTADCLPVLFADVKHGVIAAAHAGWKGAVKGILPRTVEAMCRYGADRAHIVAAIGPAISQDSYEVGEEFYQIFLADNPDNCVFFMEKAGRKHFNLPAYAAKTLENTGLAAIDLLAQDTCGQEEQFFSFRRATRRGETQYGRQISTIMLR